MAPGRVALPAPQAGDNGKWVKAASGGLVYAAITGADIADGTITKAKLGFEPSDPWVANMLGAGVCTFPKETAGGGTSATISTGRGATCRGVCRVAGTYSRVRLWIGATVYAGLTDFRVGLHNAARTSLLAQTANESAAVTAALARGEVVLNLTSTVTLAIGDIVYFAIGCQGNTAGNLTAANLIDAWNTDLVTGRVVVGRSAAGGWTGGVLPADVTSWNTVLGNGPIVELLP